MTPPEKSSIRGEVDALLKPFLPIDAHEGDAPIVGRIEITPEAWKQDDWRKNLSVEIQALERQLAAEVEGRRRRAV